VFGQNFTIPITGGIRYNLWNLEDLDVLAERCFPWYFISVFIRGLIEENSPIWRCEVKVDSLRTISDTTRRWCVVFRFLKTTLGIYRKTYSRFVPVLSKFMLNKEPVYDFEHSLALVTWVLSTTEAQKALCG
jgi:hypothetical protein